MTTVYNRNNVLNRNGASENVKTKKIEALPLWENTIAHNYICINEPPHIGGTPKRLA